MIIILWVKVYQWMVVDQIIICMILLRNYYSETVYSSYCCTSSEERVMIKAVIALNWLPYIGYEYLSGYYIP